MHPSLRLWFQVCLSNLVSLSLSWFFFFFSSRPVYTISFPHILKFSDDTCIQGLIFEEEINYRETIYWFVKWCEEHFLLLIVKKTKEMIIDFRRNKNPLTPVLINNEEIERVESYKYRRVNLDNVLNWNLHIMTLLKKLNTRLYFLRTLNSFHVDKTLPCTFYKEIVESVICFALTCWGGNSNKFLTNKIDVIIHKCNRLCQVNGLFTSFNVLYLCKCQSKIISILKNNTHPLSSLVGFSERSGKPLVIKCGLERY